MPKQTWIVDQKGRLDTFLSAKLQVAKNQTLQLIKAGCVRLNGGVCSKGGVSLKLGDVLEVLSVEPKESPPTNLPPLDLEIIYEDEDILVINKPPHLVIHHASSVKEPTLVDYLQAKGYALSTLSGALRYGIVHRLDKDTSGVLVVAKNNASHAHLANQLKSKQMGRYYLAILSKPLNAPVSVACHLGRHPNNRLKMTNLDALRIPIKGGKMSKTHFVPLITGKNQTQLICAKLETGRTHQIRAHLESLNRHIVGDPLYGQKDSYTGRILLHAYLLYATHPKDGRKLLFKANMLKDMLQYLESHFEGMSWDGLESGICGLFGGATG
ncbi:RluA family pseudouridine synthase [Helicobacter bizzozeronii]|uniref:RluA family pseudouridine synthase n=1 Tax=Helicobacter bizzozeronii TaxID=56877 RepID=UPI000CF0E349|nr:RluA family pseudouridine synthase [Helicobacter bizzozeronii]